MFKTLDLNEFCMTEEFGFLLPDPLHTLTDYFKPWNDLARRVSELVYRKELRKAVENLPCLDHTRLSCHKERRLAHVQLALIASAYVWQEGESGVARILPRSIAVPLCGISDHLGIHPIISNGTYVLSNWKLDPNTRELGCILTSPGGPESEWFAVVAIMVEFDFARGLKNILSTLQNAELGNVEELTQCLNIITSTIGNMRNSLSRMHERLSATTFYDKIRPFLAGWDKNSVLPNGLIYEGVSPEPRNVIGGSAAQSSTIQCIDAVLGIKHSPERKAYLDEMRTYMPPPHSRFLEFVEKYSQVKMTVENSGNAALKTAYNGCVEALTNFRSYHIQLVAKYIVTMAARENHTKDFENLASVGTGGSNILPFLKSLRQTTKETKLV